MSMVDLIRFGTQPCQCTDIPSSVRRVVLTGGPSAGKTEIFQLAQDLFCKHVVFVPEAATIVYQLGVPRGDSKEAIKETQRKIFQTYDELDRMASNISGIRLAIYDRSSLDGIAYWPDTQENFWAERGSSREKELAHFDTVIHLRTPSDEHAYCLHSNPVRTESVELALQLDHKVFDLWSGHPHRVVIESFKNFQDKIDCAMGILSHVN